MGRIDDWMVAEEGLTARAVVVEQLPSLLGRRSRRRHLISPRQSSVLNLFFTLKDVLQRIRLDLAKFGARSDKNHGDHFLIVCCECDERPCFCCSFFTCDFLLLDYLRGFSNLVFELGLYAFGRTVMDHNYPHFFASKSLVGIF